MRSATAGELTILAANTRLITQRVKVKNGSGTFIDLSSWVESVRIEQDIDQPIAGCTVEFRRDSGTTLSLAPLRTDSTLNRLDNGVDYSPQLDLNRVITVEEATTPIGTAPVAADYKLLFHGTIDTVNFERSPVVCSCRDLGAPLVDRWIEAVAIYGSDVGVALETVMQQILDAIFGGGFVPLYTPVSPSYVVAPAYIQQKQSMMDAQYALAQLPGWDVRYRWDDGTSSFRFTLAQPPRAMTVPDYTFGPSAYFDVTRLELDLTNVKNVITVSYYDTAFNGRLEVTVSDTTSINKYGRRYFYIQEPDGSPISTNAEATTMATAALSDLKEPKAEFEIDAPFFWPGDLWDLYRFPTNTVHFNSNQDWAVVSITHSLSRNKHRTILRVRGQPAGGYTSWIYREQGVPTPRPGEVGPEPRIEIFGPSPRHLVTVRYTATGGTAPLTYERRIDVDGISTGTYSAPAALGAGVTENIPTHQYRATRIYLRVTDATGLEGNHDPFFLKGWDASSDGAGHGVGQDEEERVRGGGGGYGIPRGRYHTEPIHDATGFDPLLDTELGQVGSALKANDGEAGIESQRAATRKGAFGAGAGAKGITEEEETRTGVGGVPVPLQRFHGIPLFDVTGFVPLIDTQTRRIQSGALGPTGIGMDTVEMGGDRGSRALNSSDKLVTGITSAAKYADGATGIDALKPAEAGANVTETRTSADTTAVAGTAAATVKDGAVKANLGLDGSGIVKVNVPRSHALANLPGLDAGSGKVDRAVTFSDSYHALAAQDTVGKTAVADMYIPTASRLKVGTNAVPSTVTKTLRVSHAAFVQNGVSVGSNDFRLGPTVTPDVANTQISVTYGLVFPIGSTLTAVRYRCYRGTTSDRADLGLVRANDTGGGTVLATLVHATTGWATLSAAISQLVGGESYYADSILKGVASLLDAQGLWLEFDYTVPDYLTSY